MLRSYFKVYFGLLLLLLSGTLLVNWLIDPLWYSQGNRLTDKNFPFDERSAKTRLLTKTKAKHYDCILLGSSRVTLLRESLFAQNTCFNYAFSAGTVDEFLKYARYAKSEGLEPEIIYLGIDASNFKQSVTVLDTAPVQLTPMYKAYLSLDVFWFSLRALSGRDLGPRYYNSQRAFESQVVKELPAYQPVFDVRDSDQGCNARALEIYRAIAAEFPEAKVVGFVPPVSAWYVVNYFYHNEKVLNCYFEAVHQLSQEFDVVYDFSIPSPVTQNPDNSYNTDHYYPKIQEQVAQMIQGAPLTFGVKVSAYSEEDYRKQYLFAIESFLLKSKRADLVQHSSLLSHTSLEP